MVEWLTHFFQNYSGYKLGWHAQRYNEVFDGNEGWEMVSMIFIIVCVIHCLVNIIYFITKCDDTLWKLFIPLAILYMASNIIFHAIVCCILLSLGPVCYLILGFIYLVAISLIAGIGAGAGEYDPWGGYFGLLAWVIQYPQHIKKYQKYKHKIRSNYEKFLNIKYE